MQRRLWLGRYLASPRRLLFAQRYGHGDGASPERLLVEFRDNPEAAAAYGRALEALTLRAPRIAQRLSSKALERAKRLVVSEAFATAVEALRQTWGISPHLPPDDYDPQRLWSPEAVLGDWLPEDRRSAADRHALDCALQSQLCRPFDLPLPQCYGLVITLTCYGLTEQDLLSQWERVSPTALATMGLGVELVVDEHEASTEAAEQLIVIAYLETLLRQAGVPVDLPRRLQRIVTRAQRRYGRVDGAGTAAALSERARAGKAPADLLLRIEPQTTLEDVRQAWPQVEFVRATAAMAPRARERVWRNFERDVFAHRKRAEGVGYEDAYDQWLDEHPGSDPVEITAVIKGARRVDVRGH